MKDLAISSTTLLTENEASNILSVPVRTLQKWRFKCRGPVYKKIGRCVRYSIADLTDYIKKSTVIPL